MEGGSQESKRSPWYMCICVLRWTYALPECREERSACRSTLKKSVGSAQARMEW